MILKADTKMLVLILLVIVVINSKQNKIRMTKQ